MFIPLRPPQSVTDAHMLELLSFFCRWKDGREKGRKCGQIFDNEWDMTPHKLKKIAIFKLNSRDLVHTFANIILKIESQSIIKNNCLLYHIPPYSPWCLNYGREKSVRSLGADRGCLRGMCPLRSWKILHFSNSIHSIWCILFVNISAYKKKKKRLGPFQ